MYKKMYDEFKPITYSGIYSLISVISTTYDYEFKDNLSYDNSSSNLLIPNNTYIDMDGFNKGIKLHPSIEILDSYIMDDELDLIDTIVYKLNILINILYLNLSFEAESLDSIGDELEDSRKLKGLIKTIYIINGTNESIYRRLTDPYTSLKSTSVLTGLYSYKTFKELSKVPPNRILTRTQYDNVSVDNVVINKSYFMYVDLFKLIYDSFLTHPSMDMVAEKYDTIELLTEIKHLIETLINKLDVRSMDDNIYLV